LYAAAAGAVGLSLIQLPGTPTPSGWLVAGVAVAATMGFALPVGIGTVGIWRVQGSFCEPVLVVCAFLLPSPWAVVAWFSGALLSGIYIRQFRTTPGGMVAGASQVTLAAALALMAPRPDVGGPAGYLACSLYLFWVYRIVSGIGWNLVNGPSTGETAWGALKLNLLPVQRLFGFACGAAMGVAGVLLAEEHVALLLLMAAPYVALLVGNANASRVQREKERMEALITLGRRLHRASTEGEVLSIVCETTADLQGCATTHLRATGPSNGEAGARVPALDGCPWLIAPARRGPPTFQGRYRQDEHRLMEVVVSVADAAIENVRLVRHHMELARVDPVTGLPNRLAMGERLESEVANATRTRDALAVLFIDFDHFKEVNDTISHDAGDAALAEVGTRLAKALRAGDVVGRWGGDEFLAIVRSTDGEAGAKAAGVRIRAELTARRVTVPGGEIAVTASIGAAVLGHHGETAEALVAAADAAAADAKEGGRDRMVVAEPTFADRAS
jgi:diguanylate cyclase (GGDEF)-like protein